MAKQKEFLVKQSIYPLDVVLGAAYVFIDKCYVFLDKGDAKHWLVRLRPKVDTTDKQFTAVVGEFENELLNQALRLKISRRTEKIRDAIVHRALYSALTEPSKDVLEDDLGDFLDDPLGIAVPWEEKFDGGADKAETPAPEAKEGDKE